MTWFSETNLLFLKKIFCLIYIVKLGYLEQTGVYFVLSGFILVNFLTVCNKGMEVIVRNIVVTPGVFW